MTPDKYFSCTNKVDYKSKETAERAVVEMKEKARNVLEAYPCRYCGGWHIGRIRTGLLLQLRLPFDEDEHA